MKTSTLRKAIPAALLVAGVSTLSSTANAAVYAIAYNNIFDLSVLSSPFVPIADFSNFNATSAAAANLNGSGASGSASNGGPVDAPIAIGTGSNFGGPAPVNNAMNDIGQIGTAYSYSDSQISKTALLQDENTGVISVSGNLTQAWGIAEGYVKPNGNADASTRNSSETGFNSAINLQDATQFSFNFKAAPYLLAQMTAPSIGVSSNAELSVIITITDGNGNTVFRWSPNGVVGGTSGDIGVAVGSEVDPFSLNTSKEVTSVAQGAATYDPTGGGAPNGVINPGAFGAFSAQTVLLAAGEYTISLDMVENTNMRNRNAIPAPGVLALMGLGLAGLGFSRRRK